MKHVLLMVLLFGSFTVFAQRTGIIKGHIGDAAANGEALLFADVHVKGTDAATQTNFNGNFELLAVPTGKQVLEVTFLGYESLEVEVEVLADNTVRIDTNMNPEQLRLEDLGIATVTASETTMEPPVTEEQED